MGFPLGISFLVKEVTLLFLDEVNKDYAVYQINKRENKDDLENNLTFARQILGHYKNHFNINCSSIFSGKNWRPSL